MKVACGCGAPRVIKYKDHGRLVFGADEIARGGPLWCPAWPRTIAMRNSLAVKPKRFRVLRPSTWPKPTTWTYTFFWRAA